MESYLWDSEDYQSLGEVAHCISERQGQEKTLLYKLMEMTVHNITKTVRGRLSGGPQVRVVTMMRYLRATQMKVLIWTKCRGRSRLCPVI